MIKFFRNIRKKLLSEGKTSRYFTYAIGEIILVVIGILIALQINNWNEYRKARTLERTLLNGAFKSIISDTLQLRGDIENYEELMEYANFIKTKFHDDSPYEQKLDTAFAQIAITHVYRPDYAAFNRIESVGIDIVKNDSLRDLLVQYYDFSKHIAYVENYFENSKYYRQKIFPKYFKTYKYGWEAKPVNYETLKSSSEFLIALDYSINDAYFFGNAARRRLKNAKKLISQLKEELKTPSDD